MSGSQARSDNMLNRSHLLTPIADMSSSVEGTDSTREEMSDLLEVLIGANVKENLVVMADNQSILRRLVDGLTRGTQPSCLYR